MLNVQKILAEKPNRTLYKVRPDQMVIEALETMEKHKIGAVLVMRGEALLGIFTERDYARKGILGGRKAKSTPVTEVMTSDVYFVHPETNIEVCMQLFSEKRVRYLPVQEEGGKVIGLVSMTDVLNTLLQDQRSHIEFLKQYISGE
ncbi:MAG: CBS domain-containing protein [Haliscomenobacteraceae bacterium CHB4]|nr:Inosine-5'-monophosphate dehydrogenase [Saprospiraceae bacterium]MCE7923815.1 CBS domain-containing protein [Haliscomenobacteraceae bacterium CHB4]